MTEFLLYLYAESPVHTGAAGSLDVLDLPVQREAATGYPVIWGQSLKGALRQAAREAWPADRVTAVFGSEVNAQNGDSSTTQGALAVGDAQLVAMPVPTLRRTFGWLTSEIALGRLARKYQVLGRAAPAVPEVPADRGAAASAVWTQAAEEVLGPCVVPMGQAPDALLTQWADRLAADAIGPGDAFAPFAAKLRADLLLAGSDLVPTLLRESTEQSVRVQLGESKTVQNGPFYSEYLPAETIMAAALFLREAAGKPEIHDEVRQLLDGRLLRIGGDETLGKGLMWGRLLEGQAE